MNGAVLVCGTTSDAGKSTVVTGLCRVLARRGVSVAPFKGQNMSLNAMVTADGGEIGRAQWVQARAAGVEPEVSMNPVLLKPTGERTSQVVVMGRPPPTETAAAYHRARRDLVGVVDGALADLRARFDVVVCEGAGSPAEINLLEHDLVNLGLARRAGLGAVVVGDIERGGVFAHLYGTVAIAPPRARLARPRIRHQPVPGRSGAAGERPQRSSRRAAAYPRSGCCRISERCRSTPRTRWPCRIGSRRTVPARRPVRPGSTWRPSVCPDCPISPTSIRWRRSPACGFAGWSTPARSGHPDLVVVGGTRSTVADLQWVRTSGLAGALGDLRAGPAPPLVLGICGGYQMLGRTISDPHATESHQPEVEGLGWLPVRTVYHRDKVIRLAETAGPEATMLRGYEVRHGRIEASAACPSWLGGDPDEGPPGARDDTGTVVGTTLHGLFEDDAFRAWFLGMVAARRGRIWRPSGVSFEALREGQIDRVADACEEHLDLDRLWRIVESAPPGAQRP